MEWLKDKKNLPIVAGLAVFVLLVMGGLIAFELGAFSGSPAPSPVASSASAYPGAPGGYPGAPGGYPGAPGGYPGGYPGAPGGYPGSSAGPFGGGGPAPAAAVATAGGAKFPVLNPMLGADPFAIPGGRKAITQVAALKSLANMKAPLSDVLPPLNLFQIHPPALSPLPALDLGRTGSEQSLGNLRVSGIVNAADGIFAIVEVNGQSQMVKPGDALLNGNRVASIQPTSITLRTPSGGIIPVPLSNGAPDPGQQNPYGGYPGGGYPGGYPGGGFGGGGYPGGGFGGGGYPGGGFGGGGYPGGGFGGGGYPGGGGGGFDGGGGGFDGGYPQ